LLRRPEPHELDRFVDCVESAFGTPIDGPRRDRYLAALDGQHVLACFDEAELVGTSVGYHARLTVPGPVHVNAVVLEDIAVLPAHRGQGHMTQLITAQLADAHARGDAFVILDASEGGIYGRYGFGPAMQCVTYAIDADAHDLLADLPATTGRILHLDPVEASDACPMVFEAVQRVTPGEIERSSWPWEEHLDRYAMSDCLRLCVAHEQAGLIDGYVLYMTSVSGDERREILVEELCAATSSAYQALVVYVLGLDRSARVRMPGRPTDEPLRYMLRDPRALHTIDVRDSAWLRIVDLHQALEQRGYEAPGRVVIQVNDVQCPWNTGSWVVGDGNSPEDSRPRDSRPRDSRSDSERVLGSRAGARVPASEAELVLDASTFAAVYLGGVEARQLLRAGRVTEVVPGAATRLDNVLRCSSRPHCLSL